MSKITSAAYRERKRAKQMEEMKKKIIENIPNLSTRDVRRHRIPYYEALCLELEEDDYILSSAFMKMLVRYQEEMNKKAGPENPICSNPQLINEKSILKHLYKELSRAEQAEQNDRRDLECEILLRLSLHYTEKESIWWWLAQQIFHLTVTISIEYTKDGGQREAIARYCFGRFVLTKLQDSKTARIQLTACRERSSGKNFTAQKFLSCPQGNLFEECCALLYKALLIQAQEMLEEDPHQASRICLIAIKRAKDAKDDQGIADCYMQYGICEMKIDDAQNALQKFTKSLKIFKKIGMNTGYCEACIHSALAYARLEKMKEAAERLEILLQFSQETNLKYYNALAHRFLGELYLNQEDSEKSTHYLLNAIPIFHELGDTENLERTRILAGISHGQQMLPKYIQLILSCETIDSPNLTKLLNWKDKREPFWEDPIEEETIEPPVISEEIFEPTIFSETDESLETTEPAATSEVDDIQH